MKLNISLIPRTIINPNSSSHNNRFFKISYAIIKNLCNKKNSKQKTGKIPESSESRTNSNTAAETITFLNSKINIKSIKKIEILKQNNINKKRNKKKIKKIRNCKLIEEFANEFNNIISKNLNNSYSINIDLMKKKLENYFSINMKDLKRNNDKFKNITNIPTRKWVENCGKNNNLRKYEALSASIKSKHLNDKIRKIPKLLKIPNVNIINFDNIYNKNKLFNSFYEEVKLCTSENKRNDPKNFECDEIAQRRPGHNKIKKNNSNKAKNKKSKESNITQINLTNKKYESIKICPNNKLNPRMSINITKFRERKTNNNNNGLKTTNSRIILVKKRSISIKNSKNNTINNSKIRSGDEIFFSRKSQMTFENKPNENKQRTKNIINIKTLKFEETGKNLKNKKFENMNFFNYKQQKNLKTILSKTYN